jgi:hypothetical protein
MSTLLSMSSTVRWFLLLILVVVTCSGAVERTITVDQSTIRKNFVYAEDGDVFKLTWSDNVKTPMRVYQVHDNTSCTLVPKGIDSDYNVYPYAFDYTTEPAPMRPAVYPAPPIIYDLHLAGKDAQECDTKPDSRLRIEVYKPGETPPHIQTATPVPSASGSSNAAAGTPVSDSTTYSSGHKSVFGKMHIFVVAIIFVVLSFT